MISVTSREFLGNAGVRKVGIQTIQTVIVRTIDVYFSSCVSFFKTTEFHLFNLYA